MLEIIHLKLFLAVCIRVTVQSTRYIVIKQLQVCPGKWSFHSSPGNINLLF